jgi:hypothetical protein
MSNNVRVKASVDDKISGPLAKIKDRFDALGKSKGAMSILQGVGMGAGITAFNLLGTAASKAGEFIGDSVDAASALNETLSKSRAVFGTNADAIERWGESAASAMGQSKNDAIKAASGFGDLFNKMKETRDESVKMSTSLVGLASDLASFNDLDPTEVLAKLKSGLAGEAEPLRSLGVFLNEAKVKAKALELGFQEVNGTFTEGAKIAARYALIMEETESAQGDFAKTSGDLANQQRALNAELENAQATIGKELLPVMLELTKIVRDIVPLMAGAVTGFLEIAQGIADISLNLAELNPRFKELQDEAAGPGFKQGTRNLKDLKDAAEDTGDGVEDSGEQIVSSFDDIGDEAYETERRTKLAFAGIERALDAAAERFRDAAREIIGDYYDPIQTKQELATIAFEIAEARKRVAAATTAQEAAEAAEELTELYRREAELQADLVAQTGVLTNESKTLLDQYVAKARDATGDAKAYYRSLIRVLIWLRQEARLAAGALTTIGKQVGDQTTGPGYSGVRAEGGPVEANKGYIVGEKGPEYFVPKTSGTIIPNGGEGKPTTWAGMQATTVPIAVNVSASGLMTPATGAQIARDIAPFLYDEMVRRGWVNRR